MRIVIITPTRNEEEYIKDTLECMIAQTVLPVKWIIVNDGSTDRTEKTIKEFEKDAPFIEYILLPDRGYRKPGQGVVEAFYEAYKTIENENYDIIAKFDADLKFPPDTLETICNAFKNDTKLGVTGGTRYEKIIENGDYEKVLVPRGFVGGPTKFYRKKCFEDINGLIRRAGWDGADTIKANMNGWKTGEIESLKVIHLKPTGTAKGEGLRRACEKYGDVSYYMGGYLWYFFLRVIGRSLEGRNLKVGYYMIKGYLRLKIKNETRESTEFRRYLKKVQVQNMIYWIRLLFGYKKLKNSESSK
jgi:glycosyltransferase involved in cell wall biosynthesis